MHFVTLNVRFITVQGTAVSGLSRLWFLPNILTNINFNICAILELTI